MTVISQMACIKGWVVGVWEGGAGVAGVGGWEAEGGLILPLRDTAVECVQ